MSNTIDFSRYKYQSYLELCLTLVEEAYQSSKEGKHDLVASQLHDILETFNSTSKTQKALSDDSNLYLFRCRNQQHH